MSTAVGLVKTEKQYYDKILKIYELYNIFITYIQYIVYCLFQIDVIEDPAIQNVVILQTVLDEVGVFNWKALSVVYSSF